jgi:pyrrolidone-carboxylate peptidase
MYTTTSAQKKTLHTAQVTKREMISLLKEAGFVVESIFPAVMRWKANNVLMRMVFTVLHYVSVKTSGRVHIPILERYATESYVYVARKTK